MVMRRWLVSKLGAVRWAGQASHDHSNTLKQRQHHGWMGQGGQGTCLVHNLVPIGSRGGLVLAGRAATSDYCNSRLVTDY